MLQHGDIQNEIVCDDCDSFLNCWANIGTPSHMKDSIQSGIALSGRGAGAFLCDMGTRVVYVGSRVAKKRHLRGRPHAISRSLDRGGGGSLIHKFAGQKRAHRGMNHQTDKRTKQRSCQNSMSRCDKN
jgi:hypothetical protein